MRPAALLHQEGHSEKADHMTDLSDIAVPCVLLKVARLYREGMDQDQVYDITHGWWVMGEQRNLAEYALEVANGKVIDAFRIHGWRVRTPEDPGFEDDTADRPRWGFDGEPASELAHLVGVDVSSLFPQGAANPVRYLNTGGPVADEEPVAGSKGQEALPVSVAEPALNSSPGLPKPTFRQAANAFAHAFLAKASLLREYELTGTQSSRLMESLSIDLRKFCDITIPAMRRPEVSVAAVARANELGIDLCQVAWHQQVAFDPGRLIFHCEHVVPIRSLREACRKATSAAEIVDALDSRTRIAWILKEEDRGLTGAGFAFLRDDPDAAYRQVGIELTRCHPREPTL